MKECSLCFEIEPKANYVVKSNLRKLCKNSNFKVSRFSHLWRVKLANFVTLYMVMIERRRERATDRNHRAWNLSICIPFDQATLVNQPKWLYANVWKWWCKGVLFFRFGQYLYAMRVWSVKLVEQAVTRRRKYIQQLLRAKNSKLKVKQNARIETMRGREREKKKRNGS